MNEAQILVAPLNTPCPSPSHHKTHDIIHVWRHRQHWLCDNQMPDCVIVKGADGDNTVTRNSLHNSIPPAVFLLSNHFTWNCCLKQSLQGKTQWLILTNFLNWAWETNMILLLGEIIAGAV
jgi:hypothetical protein